MAIGAGLREGELFALRIRDVDLAKGTVSVDATLTKNAEGKITRMKPKTVKSCRTLPVGNLASRPLRRHIKELKAKCFGTDKNDWLFPAPEGVQRSSTIFTGVYSSHY